jgi:uncharacterized membrane protein YkvA (DUF1232 family)
MLRWKRLSLLWPVVKSDARMLWRAFKHPHAPRWLRLGAVGLVLYLLSPVDLIPDVLPVVGLVDDLVLLPLGVRWLLKRLPQGIRADIGADVALPGASAAPGP